MDQGETMLKRNIFLLAVLLGACTTLPTSEEYVARGDGFVKDGKLAKAIGAYSKAVTLNPQNLQAYASRGAAYFFNGQFGLAEDDFVRVIEQNPYHGPAYSAYASALAAQGEYTNALSILEVAIRLEPEKAENYFTRAGIEFMLGQYQKAVQDYTKVLSMQPAAEVLNARGAAYLKMGKKDLAEQDFNAAKTEPMPKYLNTYSMLK